MAEFVAERVLAAAFDAEVVGPLLDGMPHAAALWGTGSDVLGYDTAQSTDHGWGPRMQVFVTEPDVARAQAALADLPETFRGCRCATAGMPCRCSATSASRPSLRGWAGTSASIPAPG